MKINKTDIKNMGFLKLFHMELMGGEECLAKINYGTRTRERTKDRYLKKLINIIAQVPHEELDDMLLAETKKMMEKSHDRSKSKTEI